MTLKILSAGEQPIFCIQSFISVKLCVRLTPVQQLWHRRGRIVPSAELPVNLEPILLVPWHLLFGHRKIAVPQRLNVM